MTMNLVSLFEEVRRGKMIGGEVKDEEIRGDVSTGCTEVRGEGSGGEMRGCKREEIWGGR